MVLSNGGYRVMDRLAEAQGESAPWPAFESIEIGAIARAMGCEAVRISGHEELLEALDEAVTGLASRAAPLLLEVVVSPDPEFHT